MPNRTRWTPIALSLALLVAAAAAADHHEGAQEMDPEMVAMMEAWEKAGEVGEPHQEMATKAGSWTATTKSWMDPAAEPMTSTGSVERTMILGGRVLEERFEGDMMGTPFVGIGRSGYDNVTGTYWSSWIDSMSTGHYVMTGDKEESGAVVYHGEYPDPMTGNMIKVRAVARSESSDKDIFEWHEDRGEGEIKTMEIVYERAGE